MRKIKFIFIFIIVIFLISCGKNQTLEYSGTIEANQVDVSSRATGEIIEVFKNEGDKVEKNDRLLSIEHEILDLKLERAKSALIGKKEQLKSAEKAFETAEKNYRRVENLYNEESVSENRFDEAENHYINAKSNYRIAGANLNKTKKEIEIIKKQIDDCTVQAPVDGTITEKMYERGELISKGAVLYTISDLQKLEVYIYVPEKDLGKIKIGGEAGVYSDTYPDRKFAGKIYHIAEEAEFTPKNVQTKEDRVKQVFKVKIKVENEDKILKPGMPCDVVINLNE
ncbi:MAG: efflux RND transporter periplasmic adaptor subunit [Candidatus Mcinerneyibacterium aminivorans]|uniref:Efflux RND transporter periplasmic adaptor subunit n=1 Tax=Candidatus Mcinerneyibacterium aminivorans TaxID=2703815 RepID=A0A5D0ME13_9BACT|nr:MAG: efflux RND transporter periplasmic adaptor subunit [Candidatus Mcinerneyibacterium aminivorans]